jgi:hypothetical protein
MTAQTPVPAIIPVPTPLAGGVPAARASGNATVR